MVRKRRLFPWFYCNSCRHLPDLQESMQKATPDAKGGVTNSTGWLLWHNSMLDPIHCRNLNWISYFIKLVVCFWYSNFPLLFAWFEFHQGVPVGIGIPNISHSGSSCHLRPPNSPSPVVNESDELCVATVF